jgi:5-methylthioribose kinase
MGGRAAEGTRLESEHRVTYRGFESPLILHVNSKRCLMSIFNKYFLMKESDCTKYISEKFNYFFSKDANLETKEIGDGNINYVFRTKDINTNKSVIVKQAGKTSRISDDFPLSTDRNRIESAILMLQSKYAPGLVPEVYYYDTVMACCIMEDLKEYTMMRSALLQHRIFPNFAEHISSFLANTLFFTSDIFMDHQEKKELQRSYINPQLCDITERLVYTEPYTNYLNRNEVIEDNKVFVEKELYQDSDLLKEVAKLKFDFMTKGQSLLHGDLHTGSIFVTEEKTKVFDPEFAFYGPMGYDIGNVIANLIFAWANGQYTMPKSAEKEKYLNWLESSIKNSIDLFKVKFTKLFEEHATDHMAKVSGFKTWYLEDVMKDTAAVCGLELNRRIVGLAKVKDITEMPMEKRIIAERFCITVAKQCILESNNIKNGENYLSILNKIFAKYPS